MRVMAKPTLVGYRRTSSDMDMSSSDDEGKPEPVSQTKNNGTAKDEDECSSMKDNNVTSKDDRLRDDRRENDRKDARSRDGGKSRRDKRKDNAESKSSDSDRRKRKSPDRSRGRHRSRSPGRRKHSPNRRNRKRSHSTEHKNSRKPRKSSRSPELFRSKRLERKVARIDKLGLEMFPDLKSGQSSSIFNSMVNPTSRMTDQIKKRRLLWAAKKEAVPEGVSDCSGTSKAWEAATFKGDNDGKMTEKFKRLMGMKADAAPAAASKAGDTFIQQQEEMFTKMEAEYQAARMATHTHRGLGLGFGTFQVPPR